MLRFTAIGLLLVTLLASSVRGQEVPQEEIGSFTVVFDKQLQPGPYTGRVYVVISRGNRPEPRRQMSNWFAPAQTFAVDAADVRPGGSVEVADVSLAFPKAMGEVAAGEYWVQAVARRSLDAPSPGGGPGDLYSKPQRIRFVAGAAGDLDLHLTEAVAEPAFRKSADVKLVEMRSKLLSDFHGRDYAVQAAVQLPAGWADDPEREWASVVMIGGFGGSHRDISRLAPLMASPEDGLRDCVVIVPNGSCGTGHSVFADSANNGPWGRMLIEELLPEVDKRFRTGGPDSRHVTGISSGGWASLWLMVTYPEQFAACWSHVPDPVSFHDFQRIDLYAPGANMYKDSDGNRRPIARNGENVVLWYDDFCRMEQVLGRGGQISSFEAVFSPRGEDGQPRPLFDRETGSVDPATAKTWEKYDICRVIEKSWRGADGATGLRERLAGKVHVYAGEVDNFYLEGAARRLQTLLAELESDAVVEVVPGMGHTFARHGVERMREAVRAANEKLAPEPAAK